MASRISAPLKVRQRRAAVLGTQIGEGEFCAATAPVSVAFVPERVATDEGCGRGKQHSARNRPHSRGRPCRLVPVTGNCIARGKGKFAYFLASK
jgi:hypothetical protein